MAFWKNQLLRPQNRKLKYFHLLVALVLYFDFYLTGCILANFKFTHRLEGYDPFFLGHDGKYTFIGTIQVIDIILNFLKIPMIEGKVLDVPDQVALLYLKSSFIPDAIAVLPWVDLNPQYIFLRYLKLAKFNTYQGYFDEFVFEIATNFVANETVKSIISIFRLLM